MVQCPVCKDYDVHESRWTGTFERVVFGAILHRPARCYSCFKRFHVVKFASLKPRGVKGHRFAPAAPVGVSSHEEKLSA